MFRRSDAGVVLPVGLPSAHDGLRSVPLPGRCGDLARMFEALAHADPCDGQALDSMTAKARRSAAGEKLLFHLPETIERRAPSVCIIRWRGGASAPIWARCAGHRRCG